MYIKHNLNWVYVILLLKSSLFSVSGGSGNKRHVISKLQSRLNTFMLALINLDYAKLNGLMNFTLYPYYPFLIFQS